MKTTPLLTLAALLGTCLLAAAQSAPPAATHPHHPPGLSAAEILRTFDKDGDGKLSLDELQAMQAARGEKMQQHRKEMLAKYDTNGDGQLSLEEFKAMQADRLAQFVQREEHRKALLAKHDTDGDGKLSEAQRAAIPKHAKGHPGGKHRPAAPPATPPAQ